MRKIITLLSTLMLVSVLLAACAGEETSTVAPGTDVPPMTEEPTLETPDGTEEPMETPTGEETGTPDAGIPVTGEEDPSRLSNQLDYDIWNGNGEQIGEVNDMIVDLDNTRVSYVIVGTGGFLEIGERDILVPWDQLMLQTATGDNATGDENAFIFQGDQQMFENAPDVDVNAILPEQGQPGNDWDVDLRNYWQSGVVPGTPEDTTAAGTATPGTDTTGNETATAMPGTDGTGAMNLQGVVLASNLLGSNISIGADGQMNQDGEVLGTGTPDATDGGTAVGTGTPDATTDTTTDDMDQVNDATIDDVIVDIDSGEIRFFVINAAFAEGDRLVPVPLDRFQWDNVNGSYILNVDQPMLEGAPFFEDGQYPDSTTEGWDTEFDTYWQ